MCVVMGESTTRQVNLQNKSLHPKSFPALMFTIQYDKNTPHSCSSAPHDLLF